MTKTVNKELISVAQGKFQFMIQPRSNEGRLILCKWRECIYKALLCIDFCVFALIQKCIVKKLKDIKLCLYDKMYTAVSHDVCPHQAAITSNDCAQPGIYNFYDDNDGF